MAQANRASESQVNNDYNQLRTTLNAFENNKITQDQATQAFQKEFAQIGKNGDLSQVQSKFSVLQKEAGAYTSGEMSDFPNLELTNSPGDSKLVNFSTLGSSERFVTLDFNKGAADTSTDGEPQTMSDSDTAFQKKFVQPMLVTADNYFQHGQDAKTTDAQITQEVQNLKSAGYDLSDPVVAHAMNASDQFLHITAISPGEWGINEDDINAYNKRIEFDPNTGAAQAETFHPELKAFAKDVAGGTAIGAAGGAILGGGFFTLPGALIGGGLGFVAGAAKGLDEDVNMESKYYGNQNIFNQ